MKICIFGASSTSLEEIYYAEAEKLGRLIAEHGHSLVFGGGRNGLMGAAARGARSAGGRIIGIAPRFFDEPEILFDNCTEFIWTDTMRERKTLMEDNADAFLVLPGGMGTFEEFFEALTLKQLWQNEKAISLLNTAGYFDDLDAMLRAACKKGFVPLSCIELYKICPTPEDALTYIESYIPRERGGRGIRDYNK